MTLTKSLSHVKSSVRVVVTKRINAAAKNYRQHNTESVCVRVCVCPPLVSKESVFHSFNASQLNG